MKENLEDFADKCICRAFPRMKNPLGNCPDSSCDGYDNACREYNPMRYFNLAEVQEILDYQDNQNSESD